MTDTVLIAGAGPTGLALAVHLALHDIPVRVVDAAPAPATTSRALGLQARGIEVLERIGALGDLPQRSRSSLNMSYNEGSRTVLRLHVGQAVADQPKQTLLISQAEVEGTLRRRLAELGGQVEWDTRLVAARQDDTGVTATVATADGCPPCSAGCGWPPPSSASATEEDRWPRPSTGGGPGCVPATGCPT
ncbi:FAD-dependent monooxygenase [Nonomuraea sp. NPDC001023]|uniref:FAD-dependent monooxygenase n=1 Tax=unclassified Nonomuraea TaxID=2593643 RepID=UPI003332D1D7